MPLPDSNAKAEQGAEHSQEVKKALAKAQRRRHRMQRDENQAANSPFEGVEPSARSSGKQEQPIKYNIYLALKRQAEQ